MSHYISVKTQQETEDVALSKYNLTL